MQTTGFEPTQVPPWHASLVRLGAVAVPSLQAVPSATKPSAGQVAELPVQLSATSHWPADDRQTVLVGKNESAGQVAELPVQLSATSQTPADGRQTVVGG